MYASPVSPHQTFLKTTEHSWTNTILSRGGRWKLLNSSLMNKLIRIEWVSDPSPFDCLPSSWMLAKTKEGLMICYELCRWGKDHQVSPHNFSQYFPTAWKLWPELSISSLALALMLDTVALSTKDSATCLTSSLETPCSTGVMILSLIYRWGFSWRLFWKAVVASFLTSFDTFLTGSQVWWLWW